MKMTWKELNLTNKKKKENEDEWRQSYVKSKYNNTNTKNNEN